MNLVLSLAVLAVSVTPGPREAAYTVDCPGSIETQQTLRAVPPGLQLIVPPASSEAGSASPRGSVLLGTRFIEGGPDSDQILAPDTSDGMLQDAGRRLHRWDFDNSESVWVSCTYRNTYLTLATRLPGGLSSCYAAWEDDPYGRFIEAWCLASAQ